MANYYGNRGNGSSLRHYRTKGSRNGYSKDPNYRPVGQQAQGKIVNGRYVYDSPSPSSSIQNGAKNNWQQRANEERQMYESANRMHSGKSRAANVNVMGYNFAVNKNGTRAELNNDKTIGTNINSVHNAQTERERSERARKMAKSSSAMKMTAAGYQPYRNGMAHPAYSEVGSANMRIAEKVAKQKASARMQAQGAANNWQQRANQDSSFGRHDEWQWSPKKPGINAVTNSTASYSPSAIQEGYTARKTGTIEGKVDMAKRALNVAKVNAKKNIKKTAKKAYDNTSKAASKVVNKGKETVNNLLKKFKKK